nr:uncharacterized protein LOC116433408 isoform X3 [Nomia melanderi]
MPATGARKATRSRARRWLVLALPILCLWEGGVRSKPEDNEPILIRPLFVYENLIKGVHDYFNNTCIILFHDSPNPTEGKELQEIDGLLGLQRYFSGTLSIRTSIMDFRTFKDRLGDTYNSIKRPLFVLLNDLDATKEQFALVSRWITMAYPTWLLFLRNDTKFEDFLSEVHVPFDCVFMVAQPDGHGIGEVIRDVYRIGKEEELRWMKFGEWDAARGFRGPRLGLYQRRHDLHGRNIRVVAVQIGLFAGSPGLADPPRRSEPHDRHRGLLRRGHSSAARRNELHVQLQGSGIVGHTVAERHVDRFHEDADRRRGGPRGHRADDDVRPAGRHRVHHARLLYQVSRVHQEARHDGGQMERVLRAVLVEHLERDRADDRDRGPDDHHDRRVHGEPRPTSPRLLDASPVRAPRGDVPRVRRVLRSRHGVVSAGSDSAGASERVPDRRGRARGLFRRADQLPRGEDVRDAVHHDGRHAGGRQLPIRRDRRLGRLHFLSEHHRWHARGHVRRAAGQRDRSADQLSGRAAARLQREQVRVHDARQHGVRAARGGRLQPGASRRHGADDDSYGGAGAQSVSRHHRYQHPAAARQRDPPEVNESGVGHAIQPAEIWLVVGRARGRDSAARLPAPLVRGHLAGAARGEADASAADRVDGHRAP